MFSSRVLTWGLKFVFTLLTTVYRERSSWKCCIAIHCSTKTFSNVFHSSSLICAILEPALRSLGPSGVSVWHDPETPLLIRNHYKIFNLLLYASLAVFLDLLWSTKFLHHIVWWANKVNFSVKGKWSIAFHISVFTKGTPPNHYNFFGHFRRMVLDWSLYLKSFLPFIIISFLPTGFWALHLRASCSSSDIRSGFSCVSCWTAFL